MDETTEQAFNAAMLALYARLQPGHVKLADRDAIVRQAFRGHTAAVLKAFIDADTDFSIVEQPTAIVADIDLLGRKVEQ